MKTYVFTYFQARRDRAARLQGAQKTIENAAPTITLTPNPRGAYTEKLFSSLNPTPEEEKTAATIRDEIFRLAA